MDAKSLVDEYYTMNQQRQREIDLPGSIDAKYFVKKSSPEVKAGVKRRKRNKAARVSRRINRT